MTFTTRPSVTCPNYVDILENGWLSASVPAGEEHKMIAYLAESHERHFSAIAARKDDPKLVIASGSAYSIGSEHDDPKGFGGSKWFIQFFDERIESTTSLWHLGEIPPEWRERISDNATLKEVW